MEKGILNSLTQVGVRTLNTHQKEQAKKYNVTVIEMKDFNLDFVKTLKEPLYISLDLDVLDPAFAPGVSHHEPGGLTTKTLFSLIQSISALYTLFPRPSSFSQPSSPSSSSSSYPSFHPS